MTVIRRSWPLALASLLLAAGLLGWWMAYALRSEPAADNAALIDTKATAAVQSGVSQALTKVLSYDYAKPQATQSAADKFLAGDARREYDTLLASLQKRAPGQQLVLTAVVKVAGVKEIDGDSAKLLVFLDQTSKRAKDSEASISAAQLAVTAKKSGQTWKVTSLRPL